MGTGSLFFFYLALRKILVQKRTSRDVLFSTFLSDVQNGKVDRVMMTMQVLSIVLKNKQTYR